MPDHFTQAEFVKSVYKLSELNLKNLKEVVLAGRSNAGKSSLINALCQRKNLAKISQMPGKTQAVNYFLVRHKHKLADSEQQVNLEFYLTDLPGYGYSASGQSKQAKFSALTDHYLESGRDFSLILLLLDIRHEPSTFDLAMLNWLSHKDYPYAVIFNKADKLSKAQQQASLKKITTTITCPYFVVSATKQTGIEPLVNAISECLLQADA